MELKDCRNVMQVCERYCWCDLALNQSVDLVKNCLWAVLVNTDWMDRLFRCGQIEAGKALGNDSGCERSLIDEFLMH